MQQASKIAVNNLITYWRVVLTKQWKLTHPFRATEWKYEPGYILWDVERLRDLFSKESLLFFSGLPYFRDWTRLSDLLTWRRSTSSPQGDKHSHIRKAFASCGVASTLKSFGLDVGDRKLPNGATIFLYSRGREMALGATVSHTCAPTYILSTSSTACAAATLAEAHKEKKPMRCSAIAWTSAL